MYKKWRFSLEIQLGKMSINQSGIVSRIEDNGEISRRIRDMGIYRGVSVKVIGQAPLRDPIAVKVNGSVISLRQKEANYIFIKS